MLNGTDTLAREGEKTWLVTLFTNGTGTTEETFDHWSHLTAALAEANSFTTPDGNHDHNWATVERGTWRNGSWWQDPDAEWFYFDGRGDVEVVESHAERMAKLDPVDDLDWVL